LVLEVVNVLLMTLVLLSGQFRCVGFLFCFFLCWFLENTIHEICFPMTNTDHIQ